MQNSDSKNIPCDFPEKGRKILHEMNSLQKKKKKEPPGGRIPWASLKKAVCYTENWPEGGNIASVSQYPQIKLGLV